jgi:hypothetical protein
MIHGARTIRLDPDLNLTIGHTMCFSELAASVVVTRPRGNGVEVVLDLAISASQLDELVDALAAVQAKVKRYVSSP